MLSEISQLEEDKNHMISRMWSIKLKLIDTENIMAVTRGKGEWEVSKG